MKAAPAVFAVLAYQGYAFSILRLGAPSIAKSFALDQSGIARMYALSARMEPFVASGNSFLVCRLRRFGERRDDQGIGPSLEISRLRSTNASRKSSLCSRLCSCMAALG
jgi:hypothetical protein